jgi:hypothetical protein
MAFPCLGLLGGQVMPQIASYEQLALDRIAMEIHAHTI